MSETTNTELLERAYSIMEQNLGTVLETMIAHNIKVNDLDTVEALVSQAERDLAMKDIFGERESSDTY